jgi:hypothetical protein
VTVATRQLDGLPNVLARYPLAVAPLVPLASRLPFVPGGGRTLPDTELAVDGVAVDAGHLAAYRDVCGFTAGDALPATYPHVLAFPLHMTLMTDGSFPFAPVGLVHVTNRIEQRAPIAADATLDLRVRAVDGPPHPKGRTFTILTEARVGGDVAWTGESTMLRTGRGSGARPEEGDPPPTEVGETWTLPEDLGRRYGAASGDRNPIHLHAATAKLFGFPRAIAHGMWTKARALAALGDVPDAFAVDVAFKRPILLPATVGLARADAGADVRFAVRGADGDPLHLDGTLTRSTT